MWTEIGTIVTKVFGVIAAIDIVLIVFIVSAKLFFNHNEAQVQKKRDDQIFEEVDRFYGAPW